MPNACDCDLCQHASAAHTYNKHVVGNDLLGEKGIMYAVQRLLFVTLGNQNTDIALTGPLNKSVAGVPPGWAWSRGRQRWEATAQRVGHGH